MCTEGFSVSDMSSDVHSGVTSFFVYSDIVEHQRVGDTHVPLLRVVQIGTRRAGEHITVSNNSPHYVPVKTKHFYHRNRFKEGSRGLSAISTR